MQCSQCGANVTDGHKFCVNCGAEITPEKPTGQRFCTKCGAQIEPGDSFCTQCGAMIAAAESNVTEAIAPTAAVADQVSHSASPATDATMVMPIATDAYMTDRSYSQNPMQTPTSTAFIASESDNMPRNTAANEIEPARKKGRKGLIVVSVVSGAIIVAAIIVGIVAFAQNDNNAPSTAPITVPENVTTDESQSETTQTPDTSSTQSGSTSSSSNGSASGSSGNQSSSNVSSNSGSSTSNNASNAGTTQKPSFSLHGSGETWIEASDYCESHGGELACIKSQSDYDEILALLENSGYIAVFVGGYYDQEKAGWYWVDGSPMTYTAWAPGEPNNENGSEYYVSLLKAPSGWGWYDDPNDITDSYNASKIGFVMESD